MKKNLILACSLVAAFALSSCGSKTSDNASATDSVADTTALDTVTEQVAAEAVDTAAAAVEAEKSKVEKVEDAAQAAEKTVETAKNNYDELLAQYKACVAKYNEAKNSKGLEAVTKAGEALKEAKKFQDKLSQAKDMTAAQAKEFTEISASIVK